ncbi:17788_t:CDS:2 [Racocetra fulgida]|uniref:17788_t:CDS:1 n=1 Tax=Racocetra fulgida TaxID=60492 RepID=A0A9N9I5S3_9GLOM|nr:17788_t:CDS:2 [Racocetra fulgida]
MKQKNPFLVDNRLKIHVWAAESRFRYFLHLENRKSWKRKKLEKQVSALKIDVNNLKDNCMLASQLLPKIIGIQEQISRLKNQQENQNNEISHIEELEKQVEQLQVQLVDNPDNQQFKKFLSNALLCANRKQGFTEQNKQLLSTVASSLEDMIPPVSREDIFRIKNLVDQGELFGQSKGDEKNLSNLNIEKQNFYRKKDDYLDDNGNIEQLQSQQEQAQIQLNQVGEKVNESISTFQTQMGKVDNEVSELTNKVDNLTTSNQQTQNEVDKIKTDSEKTEDILARHENRIDKVENHIAETKKQEANEIIEKAIQLQKREKAEAQARNQNIFNPYNPRN